MGVTKRPDNSWRARIIGSDGRERAKHFATKAQAKRWEADQLAARNRGQWVDPSSKITVVGYAREWTASRPHRITTARQVAGKIECHIAGTRLGDRRLSAVRPSEVQAWATDRAQRMAPSSMRNLLALVSAIFKAAVLDNLTGTSPVVRIAIPKQSKEKVVPLTVDQVQALADAAPRRNRAMVITQAGLGLRIGELLALRVQDVDFLRRVVHIVYQFAPGTRVRSDPKTPSSKRTIPLFQVVADAIAWHLSQYEPDADGTIFTTRFGAPYSHSYYGTTIFHAAAKLAGLPKGTMTHALRHAYASWLIEAGGVRYDRRRASRTRESKAGHLHVWTHDGREDRTRKAIDDAWAQHPDQNRIAKP